MPEPSENPKNVGSMHSSSPEICTPDMQNVGSMHSSSLEICTPDIKMSGVNTPDTILDLGVNTPDIANIANVGSTFRRVYRARYERKRKADQVKVNFFLEEEKHLRFKSLAAQLGLTLTELYPFAVEHLMECREYRKTPMSGVNTPHDDLTINETREDIIKLYKELTGNRWKPADDQLGKKFNRADSRFVELGMLYTFLRFKGKRINSFKYFLPEIENMIEELRGAKMSDETLGYLLQHRRQQAQAKLGR